MCLTIGISKYLAFRVQAETCGQVIPKPLQLFEISLGIDKTKITLMN
jgi:hypothetical protein